jgi:hypothetical protein
MQGSYIREEGGKCSRSTGKMLDHAHGIRRLIGHMPEKFRHDRDGVCRIARKEPVIDPSQEWCKAVEKRLAVWGQNQGYGARVVRILSLFYESLVYELPDFRRDVGPRHMQVFRNRCDPDASRFLKVPRREQNGKFSDTQASGRGQSPSQRLQSGDGRKEICDEFAKLQISPVNQKLRKTDRQGCLINTRRFKSSAS